MSSGKEYIKVSVAIPIYNGAKFLERAINSILNQSKKVHYIIIVDDASTDNSSEVIQIIKSKNPQTDIKYYRNETNIGYPSNWNKCFEYCKTEYLLILHQDDMLKTNAIEKLYYFLQTNHEYAIVGAYEEFINENDEIISSKKLLKTRYYEKGQIYEFVVNHGSYIACSSIMFDMDKIRKVGFFDEDVIATDELYWPKVLAKYPIAILGEKLIFRGIHKNQTEYAHFVQYEKDAFDIYKKFQRIIDYEKRPEKKEKLAKFLKLKFSKSWIGIAVNVAKQGYKIISLKYIYRAVKLNPSILFYFPKMWKTFAKIFILLLTKLRND